MEVYLMSSPSGTCVFLLLLLIFIYIVFLAGDDGGRIFFSRGSSERSLTRSRPYLLFLYVQDSIGLVEISTRLNV